MEQCRRDVVEMAKGSVKTEVFVLLATAVTSATKAGEVKLHFQGLRVYIPRTWGERTWPFSFIKQTKGILQHYSDLPSAFAYLQSQPPIIFFNKSLGHFVSNGLSGAH